MKPASTTPSLQSWRLQRQKWATLLGITQADFLLVALALLALLVFICAS